MPQPKRRRFEIRQKRKRREMSVFEKRARTLLGRTSRRLDTRPINVLFVCSQGIATSGLMQAGLQELVEKIGMQNYMVSFRGRSTFSDVFNPTRNKIDYIIFAPTNVDHNWVKNNWKRVNLKSNAEILEFPTLPNTGIFDEINYKNLIIKLLEKEAAKK